MESPNGKNAMIVEGSDLQHPTARDLVEQELLSQEQAETFLENARRDGRPFEALLAESGLIEGEALAQAFADHLGFPMVQLRDEDLAPEVLQSVAAELVQKHQCLPIARSGRYLTLAVAIPPSLELMDEIRFTTGCHLSFALTTERELLEAIEQNYDVTVKKMLEGLSAKAEGTEAKEEFFIHDLQEKASEPTLINLVNLIISEAIEEGASDIHVEPFEIEMKIKYRVDGILQEVPPPPKNLQPAIVSRIKIMAGMDIAKRHVPQDGYIRINLSKGQIVDIRVATVPTIFGEGVVMRLLNKSAILLSLDDLGFSAHTYERFAPMLESSYGIILVCGPTGSGKTTTLYAVLNKIYTPEKKIITIEDPVEYQLNGINQIPVRPGRGVTFANGLRSILRLDPDILLVGEVRDVETAEIAIRSALTGHLIFSTLHTNDAASAVTRLLDMGVEPFLIASSVLGVLAQRLVRKLCPHCRVPFTPDKGLLAQLEKSPADAEGGTFFRAKGCAHCKNRGYLGRMGVFELLEIDDSLRQLITNRDSSQAIKTAALKRMRTMREDGWEKIYHGRTTFEEVLRQTQRDHAEESFTVESV